MQSVERSLEVRVMRLERANHVLILTVILAMAGIVLVGAGSTPRNVTASSFELVDADGRVRATLTMGEDGPRMTLKDEAGVDRISISHEKEGTGMFIADAEGTTRIGVAQWAHGGGGFALHGPKSKGAAVLYLKGEGSLRFFDADGTVTAQVPAKE